MGSDESTDKCIETSGKSSTSSAPTEIGKSKKGFSGKWLPNQIRKISQGKISLEKSATGQDGRAAVLQKKQSKKEFKLSAAGSATGTADSAMGNRNSSGGGSSAAPLTA